jgi:hypothetical protein
MVDSPQIFIEMIELCATLDDKVKNKYIQKAQMLADEKKRNIFDVNFKKYLLGNHLADIYSGYRNPNFEKFFFVAIRSKPLITLWTGTLFLQSKRQGIEIVGYLDLDDLLKK